MHRELSCYAKQSDYGTAPLGKVAALSGWEGCKICITAARSACMLQPGSAARGLKRTAAAVLVGSVRNFVRRLGMIGAKEPDNAATQGTSYFGRYP
jgi:hypothetical protein